MYHKYIFSITPTPNKKMQTPAILLNIESLLSVIDLLSFMASLAFKTSILVTTKSVHKKYIKIFSLFPSNSDTARPTAPIQKNITDGFVMLNKKPRITSFM